MADIDYNTPHEQRLYICEKTLRLACAKGDIDIVRKLIEHGINVDAADRHWTTAVMYASCKGHYSVVELLLDNNADVDRTDFSEMRAISYAALFKQTRIVELLAFRGARLNSLSDDDAFPAIYYASRHKDKDMLNALIQCGADVNARFHNNYTALMTACNSKVECGDVVQLLLDNGAIVDQKDCHGCTALMRACLLGHENVMEILIRAGADIHIRNDANETAIMKACERGNKHTVQLLLSLGADVNGEDSLRQTPLMYSAKAGFYQCSALLLEYGANVNATDKFDNTALFYACEQGQYQVVKLLLKNQAGVNLLFQRYQSNLEIGKTALMGACEGGFDDIVDALISHGALSNVIDKEGNTALMYACIEEHSEAGEILLNKVNDLNVNLKNQNGCTALMYACKYGMVTTVESLLYYGADPNILSSSKITTLMYACSSRNTDIVSLLLKQKVDVNAKDKSGKTALMISAQGGCDEIISLLLQNGADPNVRANSISENCMFETSLMCAVAKGSFSCTQLLLKYQADVNATDSFGKSALIYACIFGQHELVKLLIQHQANVNLVFDKPKEKLSNIVLNKLFLRKDEAGEKGQTALMCACRGGFTDIVDTLLSHDAVSNVKDSEGYTALIYACMSQHSEIVHILLSKGCDLNVNVKNIHESTALMYACKFGMANLVETLLNYGADPNILSSQKTTTLMNACSAGSAQIVSLLLRKNVDVNAQDSSGKTALMISAQGGYEEIIYLLLKNGADPNLKDLYGNSVLLHVHFSQDNAASAKCLDTLLKAGATTEVNHNGNHVFVLASINNLTEAVKVLYKNNCLLLNGRLRPECEKIHYPLSSEMFSLLMDLELFEWKCFHLERYYRFLPSVLLLAIERGISPGFWIDSAGLESHAICSALQLAIAKSDLNLTILIVKHLYFYVEDCHYLKELPHKFTQSPVIKQLTTQPLSLFQWSFLITSKSISLAGHPCTRRKRVDALPIPEMLKNRLKFKLLDYGIQFYRRP